MANLIQASAIPVTGSQGDESLRTTRILFNTPNPWLQGGPPGHLPILEGKLRKHLELYNFDYGRKSDAETLSQKVFGRIRDLMRLRQIYRKISPDLIHLNSAFDRRSILRDAPLVLLAKSLRASIFLKIHGSLPEAFSETSWFLDRVRRIVLQNVDVIGVLSPIEQREFEDAFPDAQRKVCVVKNLVDAEFACVRRVEPVRPAILFLSRLVRGKGPFDLLRAIPLVLREEPTAEFIFAGDGEDAATFDAAVRHMNVESAVRRIPRTTRKECLELYAQAWMLVFPTYYPEGMPMVIAEAMTSGVPIIASPTRFSRSYMTEGVHILHCTPGDPEAIASRILQLCQDRQAREDMSRANRTLAATLLAEENIVQDYLNIYRRLARYRQSPNESHKYG
jgi:glycosyltransferase involved in cell wall biosynthesis